MNNNIYNIRTTRIKNNDAINLILKIAVKSLLRTLDSIHNVCLCSRWAIYKFFITLRLWCVCSIITILRFITLILHFLTVSLLSMLSPLSVFSVFIKVFRNLVHQWIHNCIMVFLLLFFDLLANQYLANKSKYYETYFSTINNLIKFALMRSIVISMYLTILSKYIFLNFSNKLLFLNKIILTPMYFSLARPSCCVADAKLKYFRVFL